MKDIKCSCCSRKPSCLAGPLVARWAVLLGVELCRSPCQGGHVLGPEAIGSASVCPNGRGELVFLTHSLYDQGGEILGIEAGPAEFHRCSSNHGSVR